MNLTDLFWLVNAFILTIIGMLLITILVKVFMLLHLVNGFVTSAQYELMRVAQDLRQTSDRVDDLSEKAANRVDAVFPVVDMGINGIRRAPSYLKARVESLFVGIRHSFLKYD